MYALAINLSGILRHRKTTFMLGLSILFSIPGFAQDEYYLTTKGSLWKNLTALFCTDCEFFPIGTYNVDFHGGISFGPDSTLYIISNQPTSSIYTLNTSNAATTLFFNGPPSGTVPPMGGMVAMGNGIFYSIPYLSSTSDSLYLWDTNAGSITPVGKLSYPPQGEMWLSNGTIYYLGRDASQVYIMQLDISNPSNSQPILTLPYSIGVFGFTATPDANLFMGLSTLPPKRMFTINKLDGSITELCQLSNGITDVKWLASVYEHLITGSDNFLDLDCDDSSLATDSDFNAPIFDCFNEGGVMVADSDVVIRMNALLESMVLEITNPVDGEDEVLIVNGPTPGITIEGEGTSTLTLLSEGTTSAEDFINALLKVRYDNLKLYPTGGMRVIQVMFTTQGGDDSNIGNAFIQVIENEQLQFDLGPDVEFCEGASTIAGAEVFGAHYLWSTGETTSSISIDQEGMYSVTIGTSTKCPNADTIEIFEMPVINISLAGDTAICDGDDATLIIISDAEFLIDIEISSFPGTPFTFTIPGGVFEFLDAPTYQTEYLISNVVPSEPACINLLDDNQFITIHSSSVDTVTVSMCEGDSVLIGNEWQHQSGLYPLALQNIVGCDSLINYSIILSPTVNIYIQATTCDSSAAGTFITQFTNPDGCDTLLTKTVTISPPDTSLVNLTSCKSAEAGISQQVLSNMSGCDSFVITNILWIPPADTSLAIKLSCDPSQWGISYQFLQSNDGCDSIVMINVIADIPDTTHMFLTSCNVADLGVFVNHYAAANACDSTVITTVTFSERDSTFIYALSCNPTDTGVFVETFTNIFGCDSVVKETVSFVSLSETFITSTTCDPSSAGNFIYALINQNGCDSIVHEFVTLLPASETFLSDVTCKSSEAGEFISTYTNQFGCDSIVTLTVSLLTPITTEINKMTCDPAQIGSTESLFTANNGCDSIVVETTELFPLPQLQIDIYDFNGYGVSCFGTNDGSASAIATGEPPFTYLWSTGSTDPVIGELIAASYSVSITDANGCTKESMISIVEPAPLSITLLVTEPDCFDQHDGTIIIELTGGVQPVRYSIDQVNFQSSSIFDGLAAGTYQITALDQNGCKTEEIIWINVPLTVDVELGEDIELIAGDTTILHALTNIPYDSIVSIHWSGLSNQDCPACLTQPVAPIITTTYSVKVTSMDGCSDEDAITLFLESSNEIYVPNIFSPNGDGVNDLLLIYGGSGIEEISEFAIFDRWGNLVFFDQHFKPNDIAHSWDGKMKNKEMNTAVFAYRAIVLLSDGSSVVKYGDITLLK